MVKIQSILYVASYNNMRSITMTTVRLTVSFLIKCIYIKLKR